jgi:hypothetical protein
MEPIVYFLIGFFAGLFMFAWALLDATKFHVWSKRNEKKMGRKTN